MNVALTLNAAPDVIDTSGAPFAVAGNRVAVLDPTAIGKHDEMLSDLTSGIFNSIHARLAGAGGTPSGFAGMSLGLGSAMQLGGAMSLGTKDAGPAAPRRDGVGIWAQAFGGTRYEQASGATGGAGHDYHGGIAGIDGWLTPGIRIGAFGGAARSDLEVDFRTQDLAADSYFGGAYASLQRNGLFARLMLTAGLSQYDSTRRVANNLAAGGIEIARAAYDGTFLSPELTIGSRFTIAGITLEPSARVRYAHLWLDGYAETGASDNLSIGARGVSLWQGRAQLAMPFTSESGTLAPRIGVEAWTSDDTVSASLLGQAISFGAAATRSPASSAPRARRASPPASAPSSTARCTWAATALPAPRPAPASRSTSSRLSATQTGPVPTGRFG